MKFNKLPVAALAVLFSLAATGVAVAQDQTEMSDQETCELAAEEAGMTSEGDIRDYVEQCMEEIRQQNALEEGSNDWQ